MATQPTDIFVLGLDTLYNCEVAGGPAEIKEKEVNWIEQIDLSGWKQDVVVWNESCKQDKILSECDMYMK